MHNFKFAILSLSFMFSFSAPVWAGPNEDLSRSMVKKDWAGIEKALEKDADFNVKTKQNQPLLLWAVAEGKNSVVEMLLSKGAAIETKGKNGETPLMVAASKGNKALVLLFLDKKAKLNAQDNQGYSALMMAANNHQVEIVKLLIAKGADLKALTHQGRTLLINAAFWGQADLVKLFLSKKEIEIHRRDHAGKNAFNYAQEKHWTAVLDLLQNAGAFE
jgi:uncharacterized protein